MERGHAEISVRRQCELLGVNRSGLYYEPVGESEENLALMRLLDEQFTRTPFYGSRRMTEWLATLGHAVNRKRVSRLMELLGIEAVYPKPKLSQPGEGHRIYPYLLRGTTVERVNQVWSTDITYIRMAQGFVYLVAVMDWFSRFGAESVAVVDHGGGLLHRGSEAGFARDGWILPTATRGRSSLPRSSPGSWRGDRSRSAWMGGGAAWITFSSSACGVRSNTRRCT